MKNYIEYIKENINQEFKIGDRVICKFEEGSKELLNKKGTVIESDNIFGTIGVEFDEDIKGHACGSKGKLGHCWRLPSESIELIEPENTDQFEEWEDI